MPFISTVYNVMLASPGDVNEERKLAREIIWEWNYVHSTNKKIVLLPIGWETHSSPLLGDRPQEIINNQVTGHSDLLVGIFWTRIGTPTGKSISGSAEEIEAHIKAGKPAMLYFSNKPASLDKVDREQYEVLMGFKKEYMKKGLIETFSTIDEFKQKFERQLVIQINNNSYFKGIEPDEIMVKQAGKATPADEYINKLADIEQQKLKLSVKPKLWLNGAATMGGDEVRIDLNNKGETAYLKNFRLISGDIALHSLSLPYELNKDDRRFIFARALRGNNINDLNYAIEVDYQDELGNEFIIVIEGKGANVKIVKTIEK